MSQLAAARKEQARRLEWFRRARLGMFIHWGLYSQWGRGEWVQMVECWPREEYEPLADTWRPRRGCQREWAQLARESGCRYMVMTTKHHEGFCLFDSETTDYNAAQRGPGRDLVAEYVEAVREQGLRVGLYYSFLDFHHPDYARCTTNRKAQERYVEHLHAQVREICSNYGQIDVLWYDGDWLLDAEQLQSQRLNAMVRELQPDILINNRSNVPEDFSILEGHLLAKEIKGMWEVCMTTNDSWPYVPTDRQWKPPAKLLSMLREVAAQEKNFLLNVGPDAEGNIPSEARAIFNALGDWLRKYGKSLYEATDTVPQGWAWGYTGRFTVLGNTMYYHVNRWPGKELVIGGLGNRVLEVRFMGVQGRKGRKIKFRQVGRQLFLSGLPQEPPDPLATVIQIEVEGKPKAATGGWPC
ncbi:MAG: alpha-L-fucosidase [candidate division WS1 bacterium]|nr:alpha-L-fucosidase [candidate division WS1 bacterium]